MFNLEKWALAVTLGLAPWLPTLDQSAAEEATQRAQESSASRPQIAPATRPDSFAAESRIEELERRLQYEQDITEKAMAALAASKAQPIPPNARPSEEQARRVSELRSALESRLDNLDRVVQRLNVLPRTAP
jgi:hypothetical protein